MLLCERTPLKTIVKVSLNEENKEIKNKVNCVDEESETEKHEEETTTIENEQPEATTIIVDEATLKNDNHKEFCRNHENFIFNGVITCKDEDEETECELSCEEGTTPDSPFANPYKCSYSTGIISPKLPKCLQGNNN